MKKLPEIKALQALARLKSDFQIFIRENYEHRAENCQTCPTRGACCLDAHFVNVHISKLEAVTIRKTLEGLSAEKRSEVYRRTREAIEKYDLKSTGDTFQKTFACPLFEKDTGCLVHSEGKPAPCIAHACYENQTDLPPDELQARIESSIERLNERVYGNSPAWLPLPIWVEAVGRSADEQVSAEIGD